MCHNSVTVRDIFMLGIYIRTERDVMQKDDCSPFLSFQVIPLYFFPDILVCAITVKWLRISSCKFIGICFRLG